jgi:alpha-L-arabinofuranosidase
MTTQMEICSNTVKSASALLAVLLWAPLGGPCLAAETEAVIHVRNNVLHRLSPNLIGFNFEDLNSQTYGGVYSQLLYGQDFEEHVDLDDLMPVPPGGHKYLYLRRQPDGGVNLVTYGVERGDPRDTQDHLKVDVGNRRVPLEQFAPELQARIRSRMTGDQQVSCYWRAVRGKDPEGRFTLTTEGPFNGLQDQRIEFVSGSGELGIANFGLFRKGIKLEGGKPYEGVLRVRTEEPQDLSVSLRGPDGVVLAEKTVRIGRSKDGLVRGFERVEFTLTPAASALGSFAITLKSPGAVTLGYAFLQPGSWGRFEGLPLRKELVEAIQGMNPRIIRYNGGMISDPVVKDVFRWKNMIGPRDLRIPFNGTFNPFATHGFGMFEFLDMAQAMKVIGVVGVRSDELPQDYLDLLEYANGPIDSHWGGLRGRHGHPAPYGLRYVQFGNEEGPTLEHAERFKAVARAVWERHPEIVFVMGDTWVSHESEEDLQRLFRPDQLMGQRVPIAADLLRFAKSLGKADQFWWDLHVHAPAAHHELYEPLSARDGIKGALEFRSQVMKLAPDCTFHLAFLEENGGQAGMIRALCHARNAHAIARADGIVAATVANCLQADQLDRCWGQGKIFFNESAVWLQPPYYVDQMISRHGAPLVLECEYSSRGNHINALARKSDDGKTLILTVVNLNSNPVTARLRFDGFDLAGVHTVTAETLSASSLADLNTAEKPDKIVPVIERRPLEFQSSTSPWTFPGFSFSLLRIAR